MAGSPVHFDPGSTSNYFFYDGMHWVHETQWERQRRGWDSWEPTSVPRPAPLPVYQRQYEGNRYPAAELQATLQDRNCPFKSQHDMR